MTNQPPDDIIGHLLVIIRDINEDVDEIEDRMESLAATIDDMREVAGV